MLAQASSLAESKPALAVTATKGSSSETSDQGSEDQTPGQPIATSENEAVDTQQIAIAGSTIRNSAPMIAGNQNQYSEAGRAALTIGRIASSAHSQPQSKASQPAGNQVTDSIQQAGDQGAAQQIVVSMPAVMLSEVSFGRSMQRAAASPTASAVLPVVPSSPQPNANSIAQTGSNGADNSQSPLPPYASPSVGPSEVSSNRSMQFDATSSTVSAVPPAVPASSQPNANSIAQTGSDGADASQNQVPPSAAPALTLSEVSFGHSMQRGAGSPMVSSAPTRRPRGPVVERQLRCSRRKRRSRLQPKLSAPVYLACCHTVGSFIWPLDAVGGRFSDGVREHVGISCGSSVEREPHCANRKRRSRRQPKLSALACRHTFRTFVWPFDATRGSFSDGFCGLARISLGSAAERELHCAKRKRRSRHQPKLSAPVRFACCRTVRSFC